MKINYILIFLLIIFLAIMCISIEKFTIPKPYHQPCICPQNYENFYTKEYVQNLVKTNCGYDVTDVSYGTSFPQVKWTASNGRIGYLCGVGSIAPCRLGGIDC